MMTVTSEVLGKGGTSKHQLQFLSVHRTKSNQWEYQRCRTVKDGAEHFQHAKKECLKALGSVHATEFPSNHCYVTKLSRWQRHRRVDGVAGILCRRLERIFQRLTPLVPPAVTSAVVRTFWNGLCTDRRMLQLRGSPCKLGPLCTGEDSIGHYASCIHVKDFARQKLGLPSHATGLSYFPLLENVEEPTLIRIAFLVYAVYTTVNQIRRGGQRPEIAQHWLWERVHSVGTGHDNCQAALSRSLAATNSTCG